MQLCSTIGEHGFWSDEATVTVKLSVLATVTHKNCSSQRANLVLSRGGGTETVKQRAFSVLERWQSPHMVETYVTLAAADC